MTAEIIVMNREAVVLASDSAVTSHTGVVDKVSTSANKLFRMSNRHPVGIMIYGNALFMGMPWETIIKEYRKTKLPRNGFDSLEEYAKDFMSFLQYSNLGFSEVAEDNYIGAFVGTIIETMRKNIMGRIQEDVREKGQSFERSMMTDIATEVIQGQYQSYRNQERHIRLKQVRAVMQKYERGIDRDIKLIASQFDLGSELRSVIYETIVYAFARSFAGDLYTGVVVAGFGEKEFFPVVASHKVEGIIQCELRGQLNEILKYTWDEDHSMKNVIAAVIPFAQAEMIHRFMDGVDPDYRYAEGDFLRDLCSDFINKIVRQLSLYNAAQRRQIKQKLRKYGDRLIDGFTSEMDRFTKMAFSDPTVDAVSRLPKDELATMAETLIYLTYLKRKVSPELETVSEPIDVAVITKGDGFVWIKRKHYFDIALNPRFSSTRLQEFENERNTEDQAA